MRVMLPRIGTSEFVDLRVDELERLAAADRFGEHTLTNDPAEADVILFPQCHMVDWRLRAIREHPIAVRYWEKVMVCDERDRPWRSFPGLYVSMPSTSFDARSQRAWGYLGVQVHSTPESEPDILFSFVGSRTAPCRDALFRLRHPNAIIEETHDFMFWDTSAPSFVERRERFLETVARSRFVLCPRGRGTSSIRLYETLAAGRVPVIISDAWVPPGGPAWETFSVRWPEGNPAGLIERLEAEATRWPDMKDRAARAFSEYFASNVLFHRIVEQCRQLRGCERPSSGAMRVRSFAAAARDRLPSLRVV